MIATDGEKSFVFFIYTDVQWGEATIGFDAGDGRRGFNLLGSPAEDVREVEESNNIGVAGVYAFRVDLPEIVGPGGENSAYHKPHVHSIIDAVLNFLHCCRLWWAGWCHSFVQRVFCLEWGSGVLSQFLMDTSVWG